MFLSLCKNFPRAFLNDIQLKLRNHVDINAYNGRICFRIYNVVYRPGNTLKKIDSQHIFNIHVKSVA